MKQLCILIFTIFLILTCFNQLLAPNLSQDHFDDRSENIAEILRLNGVLKEKYHYYPHVDTSTIYFDHKFLNETIHKMLFIQAMCDQEVGLTFFEYQKLTVKQKLLLVFNRKEQAVGILQIRPIMHRHLTKVKGLVNYGIHDRWEADKSIHMFIVFQDYYNPAWNLEKGSRDWNGGGDLGMGKTTTLKYYASVKEKYNVLREKFLI